MTTKMMTAIALTARSLTPHIGKSINDPTVPTEVLGYYPVVNDDMIITDWHFADAPQVGYVLHESGDFLVEAE